MLEYRRIFTGGVCSNDCRHCRVDDRRNRPDDEIMAELVGDESLQGVEFYGGEPLTRYGFSRLITSARHGFRRVKVLTNGRALAKPEVLQAAVDAGVTGFEVKLWAANSGLHDQLTSRDGSFIETITGLAALRNSPSRPYAAIRVPVCQENLGGLPDISRVGVTLQVDRLIFEPVDARLSLTEASQAIRLAIEMAVTNKVWAMSEKMPLCAMSGYEQHVVEMLLPPDDERVKVEECGKCACESVCDGIAGAWAESVRPEIEPVEESEIVEDVRIIRDEKKAKSPAYNI